MHMHQNNRRQAPLAGASLTSWPISSQRNATSATTTTDMIRIPTATVCRSHAALAPRIAVAQTKRKLHLFLRHAARPALVAVHPLPRRRLLARAYSSSTEWRSTGAGPTGVGPTDARPGGEGGRDGGGSSPLPASGSPVGVWPAPADQIEAARALIAETFVPPLPRPWPPAHVPARQP